MAVYPTCGRLVSTLKRVAREKVDAAERARNEGAAAAQRDGARRLSIEERFRQNDSISRLRVEALRSRRR